MGNKDSFKKDLLISFGIFATCFILMYFVLGFFRFGLKTPYTYDGDDVNQWYMLAKLIKEKGWLVHNDRLGAPFGSDIYDFSGFYLMNFELLIVKLLVMVTRDIYVTMNVSLLINYSLCCSMAYLVLRQIGTGRAISAIGSFFYGVSPYMFFRSLMHFSLSVCYFVPLSVLLCIWCATEGEDYLKIGKGFFKNPKNIMTLVFIVLIPNNGWGYYAIFTCYFLLFSCVIRYFRTRSLRQAAKPLGVIFLIALFFMIALIPVFIFEAKNGNNLDVASREPVQSEIYSLQIAEMLIPFNTHGWKIFSSINGRFNNNMLYINENVSSYLGIAGIIGFFLSLITLICPFKKDDRKTDILKIMSSFIVFAILLGTFGGFSALVSLYFTLLRSYNRISIFILFMCIVVLAIYSERFMEYVKDRKSKASKVLLYAAAAVILLVSVYDVLPGFTEHYEEFSRNARELQIDREFFGSIEDILEDGDMVYVMPYHRFPEGGRSNEMNDYLLMNAYLNTDTVRWSYGGIKGRSSDLWNLSVRSWDLTMRINEVRREGFSGVYIDRRGYTEGEIENMIPELTEYLGTDPLVSSDGQRFFFKF